jgi:two-component system, OmpR family, heavy metal sensor histidine kinase CusS
VFGKSLKTLSIVTRLTISYSTALILSFTLGTVILYWGLMRAINHELNLIVRDRFEAIIHSLERPDGVNRLSSHIADEWALHRTEITYFKIEDVKNKKVVVMSPDINGISAEQYFGELPSFVSSMAKGHGHKFQMAKGIFYGSAKEWTSPTGAIYRISVVISSDRENQILEQYRFSALGTLLVMTLLSILAGERLAKFSFRPLDIIIEKAKNIQASKLSERLEEKNLPKEIANLASTLNGALDRLEDSFDRLVRFSSGIAHELRTPVTNIMVQIEVVLNSNRNVEEYKDVMVSVIEESRRLTKMIDKMLLLARIEYPEQSLQIESVDLLSEIHNLVDFYLAMAEEHSLQINFAVNEGLQLMCDRSLFQRALSNLITNSINYTPEKGEISIRAYRNGNDVCVAVKDTGIGIPKADLARVFERFYRVDPSRHAAKIGGSGLGLSIVQSVMRLHSGEICIESEEKRGTTAILVFPDLSGKAGARRLNNEPNHKA